MALTVKDPANITSPPHLGAGLFAGSFFDFFSETPYSFIMPAGLVCVSV